MTQKHKRIQAVVALLISLAFVIPGSATIGEKGNTTAEVTILQKNRSEPWTEQVKLTASDGDTLGFFGQTLCIHNEGALIGSHGDDTFGMFSGAAYVFKKTGNTWTETQKLYASDAEADDMFGMSVSADEEYALIGKPDTNSPGAVYVFKNMNGTWMQQQILTAADGEIWDEFGYAVSLDREYALIGSQFDDDIGSAYIFKRDGTLWTEEAKLTPSDGELNDCFGSSVSLQGNVAVIGALNHDDSTGAIYIFRRNGSVWTEEAILIGSDSQVQDRFGLSVDVQENTVIAGARLCNFDFKGAVYIFNYEEGTWREEQKLIPSDSHAGQSFGLSVALDNDCLFVGAPGSTDNSGSAYVFTYNGTEFVETQKVIPSDPTLSSEFGFAVSVLGTTALIGKYAEDDFTGSAYVFSTEPQEEEFFIITEGGLGFTAVFYNNGTTDSNNVSVRLQVQGGILGRINRTITDTVDIPARGIARIFTGLFVGLGQVTITASANATERTVSGFQLVIISKSYDTSTWKRHTDSQLDEGGVIAITRIPQENSISSKTGDVENTSTVPAALKSMYLKADCQRIILYRPVLWITHIGPLWFMSEYAFLAFIIDKECTLLLDGESQTIDVPAMVIPYRFFGLGPVFPMIRSITKPLDGNVTLIGWCEDVVVHPLE